MIRDPRINPCAGDEIVQTRSRIPIKVIAVTYTHVEWQEWTPRKQRMHYNKWTIRGWREVIAKDAEVVRTIASTVSNQNLATPRHEAEAVRASPKKDP